MAIDVEHLGSIRHWAPSRLAWQTSEDWQYRIHGWCYKASTVVFPVFQSDVTDPDPSMTADLPYSTAPSNLVT